MIVARALSIALTYRATSYLIPEFIFIMPFAKSTSSLDSWSSFASDHAVLFYSLATSIFFISRKLRIVTGIYVFLFICFLRLYLGYHYATDILVGAIVSIGITSLVWINKISRPVTTTLLPVLNKKPGFFYALFFLLTFQLCSLFSDTRILGGYMVRLLQRFLR